MDSAAPSNLRSPKADDGGIQGSLMVGSLGRWLDLFLPRLMLKLLSGKSAREKPKTALG
jgi:hypothetical protein